MNPTLSLQMATQLLDTTVEQSSFLCLCHLSWTLHFHMHLGLLLPFQFWPTSACPARDSPRASELLRLRHMYCTLKVIAPLLSALEKPFWPFLAV